MIKTLIAFVLGIIIGGRLGRTALQSMYSKAIDTFTSRDLPGILSSALMGTGGTGGNGMSNAVKATVTNVVNSKKTEIQGQVKNALMDYVNNILSRYLGW